MMHSDDRSPTLLMSPKLPMEVSSTDNKKQFFSYSNSPRSSAGSRFTGQMTFVVESSSKSDHATPTDAHVNGIHRNLPQVINIVATKHGRNNGIRRDISTLPTEASPSMPAIPNGVHRNLPSSSLHSSENCNHVQIYPSHTVYTSTACAKSHSSNGEHSQAPARPSTSPPLCRPWLTPSNTEAVDTQVYRETSMESHQQADVKQSVSRVNEVNQDHSPGNSALNLDSAPTSGVFCSANASPRVSDESCFRSQRSINTSDIPPSFDTNADHGSHYRNGHISKKKRKHKEGHKKKKKEREKKRERTEGHKSHKLKVEASNGIQLANRIEDSIKSTFLTSPDADATTTEKHLVPQEVIRISTTIKETDHGDTTTAVGASIHPVEQRVSSESSPTTAFSFSNLGAKHTSTILKKHLPPRKRHKIYMETISTCVPNATNRPSCTTNDLQHENSSTSQQDQGKETNRSSVRDLNGLTLLATECARQLPACLPSSPVGATLEKSKPKRSENSGHHPSLLTNCNVSLDRNNGPQSLSIYSTKSDVSVSTGEQFNTNYTSSDTLRCVEDPQKYAGVNIATANRSGYGSEINHIKTSSETSFANLEEESSQTLPRSQNTSAICTTHATSVTKCAYPSSDTSPVNLPNTSSLSDGMKPVTLPGISSIFTFPNLSKVTYTKGLYLPSSVRMSTAVSTSGSPTFSPYQIPGGSNGAKLSTDSSSSLVVGMNQQNIEGCRPLLPSVNGLLPFAYHSRPQQVVPQNLDSKVPYPQPTPIMNHQFATWSNPSIQTAITLQQNTSSSSPVVCQATTKSVVTMGPSISSVQEQNVKLLHQVPVYSTTNQCSDQCVISGNGRTLLTADTSNTTSSQNVVTVPVSFNGIAMHSIPIENLPQTHEIVHPAIARNMMPCRNGLTTQTTNVIPRQEPPPFGIIGMSNPTVPMLLTPNNSSSPTPPSSTTFVPILPHKITTHGIHQSAAPTTQQISQTLTMPSAAFNPSPNVTPLPCLPASVLSTPFLPSTVSEFVNDPSSTALPTTGANLGHVTQQVIQTPLMNLPSATPTTQQCHISPPLVPDSLLSGQHLNGALTLPINSTLSTIDASQIALSSHVNGYTFPVNGTVREAINVNATFMGGQYSDAYAPLKRAPGRTQLAKHISSGMPVGETSFLCDVCNKVFPLQRLLKRHMKCHNAMKKYHCAFCSKGFNDTFDLKRHVRTHTGVRPYKCNECGKAFTQRCSLESHLNKVHSKHSVFNYKERRSKIYVCEECGHTTTIADQHYEHIKDNHPDSGELRKYQDKVQLKKLVLDNSSQSMSGESGGSISPTLSPDPDSNDGFASNI